jgi:hypothetical protein
VGARAADDRLRRRALDLLGAYGDALARDALETGVVELEHDVAVWQGTGGPVRGHRAVLSVAPELLARLDESHAARDALAQALAAALAERAGEALSDLVYAVRGAPAAGPSGGPYRGGA